MSSYIRPQDSASEVGIDLDTANKIKTMCKKLINEHHESLQHIKYLKEQKEKAEEEWKEQLKAERKRLSNIERQLKPFFDTFENDVLKDSSTGNSVVRLKEEKVSFPSTKTIKQRISEDKKLEVYRSMFDSLMTTLQKQRTCVKLSPGDE